jgi:hypothetical protein
MSQHDVAIRRHPLHMVGVHSRHTTGRIPQDHQTKNHRGCPDGLMRVCWRHCHQYLSRIYPLRDRNPQRRVRIVVTLVRTGEFAAAWSAGHPSWKDAVIIEPTEPIIREDDRPIAWCRVDVLWCVVHDGIHALQYTINKMFVKG